MHPVHKITYITYIWDVWNFWRLSCEIYSNCTTHGYALKSVCGQLVKMKFEPDGIFYPILHIYACLHSLTTGIRNHLFNGRGCAEH